ncbi:TPA: type I toxin-antitoxin system Ibs family toxin [Escherichia coli]|nr:type I toxin-antitoxin system Ibs family toxin [Escherichia coli]
MMKILISVVLLVISFPAY